MKLLHCADLHLDARMSAHLDGQQAERRRGELLHTFVRMVEYAATNGVAAILIAGDLFDTSHTREITRSTVMNSILSHPGIAFFYLKGNHDERNFLYELDSPPDNLKLFSDGWSVYECGNVAIYGAVLPVTGGSAILDSLQTDEKKCNIVMLHGQTTEGTGADWEINLKKLRGKGIDYLALGHLHSHFTDRLDERGVLCNPGCLEGRGFDECGTCGFVRLETDEAAHLADMQFIPFASRRLFSVTADVTGCQSTHDMIQTIALCISEAGCEEADHVRVILRGELDADCEKDLSFIRTAFGNHFDDFGVVDETRLKVEWQEYLLDESLKGEFIRTVMGEESLTDEEKAAIVRVGLQALSGEEAR